MVKPTTAGANSCSCLRDSNEIIVLDVPVEFGKVEAPDKRKEKKEKREKR